MADQGKLTPIAKRGRPARAKPDDKAIEPQSKDDRLLETVLKTGNIETLERFIALREREQERQARMEFDRNFAKLQSELQPVVKSKIAKNGDKKMYSYAPLDAIQAACNAVIFKHGFSYSWREEALAENAKRTILVISGWGWQRETSFDSPLIPGTTVQNAIQIAGAQSTYGRRYTFVAGFGIVLEGEDSDAAIPDDRGMIEMDLREWIKSGKLDANAIAVIESALDNPENQANIKGYWKRAKAIVEGTK